MKWYRKPGGSVHAFEGISSLCRRFYWQASWTVAEPETSEADAADRCPACAQLVDPPSRMSEDTLIQAYGGLSIDR